MTIDIAITLATLGFVIAGLVASKISADLILLGALCFLIICDVLPPAQALLGFANPGVITIAVLYIVAAGLINTGAVQWVASLLLGRPSSVAMAQMRLLFPSAGLSAFVNNTAVVAMFIPAVQDWASRLKLSPSKLLLPLSYAAILGGTCSLIGTSTNLIVDGMLQNEYGINLSLFDIAKLGIPLVVIGGVYLYFFGNKLLPDHSGPQAQINELRQYCVHFRVEENGPLAGLSIENAGLRNLNSGFLIELEREDELLAAVSPHWVMKGGDILAFIGAPELASELRSIRGLQPASDDMGHLNIETQKRKMVEVVVGPDFPGIGKSLKETKFRTRFNAVILSISRGGERLPGKLGDIVFKVGDTLLLEAADEFVENYQFRKDFLLVSAINDSSPPDFHKAPMAMMIMFGMIALPVTGIASILEAAMLAAGAMILTGCVSPSKARRQVDLQVIAVIAGAIGIGMAMAESGAAALIAETVLPKDLQSPVVALIIIYLLTVLFTEIITNNAAAVLMFPIAQSYAQSLQIDILPFAFAIMIAASASFVTPLGYQTNLMVYGPGQYRYRDYLKLGLPLSILVAVVSLTLIPMFWDFKAL